MTATVCALETLYVFGTLFLPLEHFNRPILSCGQHLVYYFVNFLHIDYPPRTVRGFGNWGPMRNDRAITEAKTHRETEIDRER